MKDDTVTSHLQRRLQHCLTPRRHQAITHRWSTTHPALAGIGIADMLDTCRRRTVEQNPIVAALIELHQSDDDDATTVLLSACRPLFYGVVRHAQRCASTDGTSGTQTTNYWAALGHVLATIEPTPPVDGDGRPKPFLDEIGIALFRTRKQIDASERRRHRYNRAGGDNRIIALTDEIVEEQHHRRWADELHDIENQALCRIELSRIADVVRSGTVSLQRWQRLVDHRITPLGASSPADRVAAHRTATKLAELVDHAA